MLFKAEHQRREESPPLRCFAGIQPDSHPPDRQNLFLRFFLETAEDAKGAKKNEEQTVAFFFELKTVSLFQSFIFLLVSLYPGLRPGLPVCDPSGVFFKREL